MYERFTDRARKVMGYANSEAVRFGYEYIGTEHLLLGFCVEGKGIGANCLKNLGVDLRILSLDTESTLTRGPGETSVPGRLPHSPRAKRVVELALAASRDLGNNWVGTEHLLLGMLGEKQSAAAQMLEKFGVTAEKVEAERVKIMTHKVSLLGSDEAKVEEMARNLSKWTTTVSMSHKPSLEELGGEILEKLRLLKGEIADLSKMVKPAPIFVKMANPSMEEAARIVDVIKDGMLPTADGKSGVVVVHDGEDVEITSTTNGYRIESEWDGRRAAVEAPTMEGVLKLRDEQNKPFVSKESRRFTMTEARQVAAQCWCDKSTSHKVMDPDLAEVFAEKLVAVFNGEWNVVENVSTEPGVEVWRTGGAKDMDFVGETVATFADRELEKTLGLKREGDKFVSVDPPVVISAPVQEPPK